MNDKINYDLKMYRIFLKDIKSIIDYCNSKDDTFLGPVQKQEIKDYLELFLFDEYGELNQI